MNVEQIGAAEGAHAGFVYGTELALIFKMD